MFIFENNRIRLPEDHVQLEEIATESSENLLNRKNSLKNRQK